MLILVLPPVAFQIDTFLQVLFFLGENKSSCHLMFYANIMEYASSQMVCHSSCIFIIPKEICTIYMCRSSMSLIAPPDFFSQNDATLKTKKDSIYKVGPY